MQEIKAPMKYSLSEGDLSIFLAGSIEMGEAEDWQVAVVDALSDYDVYLLNPRRDDWNSSWEQRMSNPNFREQVEWELKAQENADIIFMYFSPETKSPITLLELGLFAKENIYVCCPDGFWRKGNVEIVCQRYCERRLFHTLAEMLIQLKSDLRGKGK